MTHHAITPLFHHDLSACNTMALQCTADVAITLSHGEQIPPAIAFAKQQGLPLMVLSGGSNVLLPKQLRAVVLLPNITGIDIIQDSDTDVIISVGAGENWHDFVATCLTKGWYGLENLALIPGLVGASPVQNIGAYGVQISDFLYALTATDLNTGEVCTFNNDECQFAYRDSLFKRLPNRYLISQVAFKLHKNPKHIKTDYGDLAEVATQIAHDNARDSVTPQDIFDAVVRIRQSKLPDPSELANCGSFFQNPIISQDKFTTLKAQYPDLPSYPVSDSEVKIPAGWLIDKAGLKGKGVFPILTHAKQALVLTNHARLTATQNDIKTAQDFIADTVHDKFGVTLVREPVWITETGGIGE